MHMDDLAGAGKAIEKLLDVLQSGVQGLAAPWQEERMAKSRAESIRVLGAAQLKVDNERAQAATQLCIRKQFLLAGAGAEIRERAHRRAAAREEVGQHNLENVARFALEALPEQVSATPVNETWQRRFFSLASDICEEEMQILWGKILAGEVASPGRFSLRTLDVVRNLSTTEAREFENVCRFMIFDRAEKVAVLPNLRPRTFDETYSPFGLEFSSILRLQDAGLLAETEIGLYTEPASVEYHLQISGREIKVYCDLGQARALIDGTPLTSAGLDLFHLAFTSGIVEFLKEVISAIDVGGRSRNLHFEIEEPPDSNMYIPFAPFLDRPPQ